MNGTKDEMIRMEELEQARKEVDKTEGKKPMKQDMFLFNKTHTRQSRNVEEKNN